MKKLSLANFGRNNRFLFVINILLLTAIAILNLPSNRIYYESLMMELSFGIALIGLLLQIALVGSMALIRKLRNQAGKDKFLQGTVNIIGWICIAGASHIWLPAHLIIAIAVSLLLISFPFWIKEHDQTS